MEPLIKLDNKLYQCELYNLKEYLVIKSVEVINAEIQDIIIKFKCFNDFRNGYSGKFYIKPKTPLDKKVIVNKCIPLTPNFNNVELNAISESNSTFEIVVELYLNR
jgi:hypothetical protein